MEKSKFSDFFFCFDTNHTNFAQNSRKNKSENWAHNLPKMSTSVSV